MKKKRAIFVLSLIIFLSITTYYSHKTYIDCLGFKRDRLLLEKRKTAFGILEKEIKKEIANFVGEVSVTIKDLDKGWEITIDQNKAFPSASLIKVPIMAACFYAVNEKKIDLEEKIRLKAIHKVPGSGLLRNQPIGKEFTIEELIELMIVESDNTATNILISRLGFNYLNETFKRFELEDTCVNRNMMDFGKRREGIENFTSARDLKLLLIKIYNGSVINRDITLKCLSFLKRQKIRDRIPAKLPLDVVVAHKTGLEKNVCHDVGIVFTPKGDFLICVLTKHKYKSSIKAKKFISQVTFLTYNYYQGF